jgi:hypothetical protein
LDCSWKSSWQLPSYYPCNSDSAPAKWTSSDRAAAALASPCVRTAWVATGMNSGALAYSGASRAAEPGGRGSAWAGENCTGLADLGWASKSCCAEAKVTAEAFDRAGHLAYLRKPVYASRVRTERSWVAGAFRETGHPGALEPAALALAQRLVAAATVRTRRMEPSSLGLPTGLVVNALIARVVGAPKTTQTSDTRIPVRVLLDAAPVF